MTQQIILYASTDEDTTIVPELFAAIDTRLSVIIVNDGESFIARYVQLAQQETQPLLAIIDYGVPGVSGANVARSVRGIERGLGLATTAIILRCHPENSPETAQVIPELGRAVQLTRKAEYAPTQQLKRLAKASAKVITQLKGRGRQ